MLIAQRLSCMLEAPRQRPLAEHVSREEAIAAVQHYGTRRTPAGLFHSAWSHIEYAMSQQVALDDDLRQTYSDYTQEIIAMTIDHPRVSQDTRLGALVLSTYVPLFMKRSLDEDITRDDCRGVYRSLGSALSYLRPLNIDEPPQWRMTEIAVLALSARTTQPELLLYPTSPREEAASDFRFNHDSYFLHNNDKIPIQQKLIETQQEYSDWVRILELQPIVERTLQKVGGGAPQDMASQMNMLLATLISETAGVELSRCETIFLNTMSEAVVAHRSAQCSPMSATEVAA